MVLEPLSSPYEMGRFELDKLPTHNLKENWHKVEVVLPPRFVRSVKWPALPSPYLFLHPCKWELLSPSKTSVLKGWQRIC